MCINICKHVHVYIYIYTYMIYAYMYVCLLLARTSTCAYIQIYTCVYIYIYIYIYICNVSIDFILVVFLCVYATYDAHDVFLSCSLHVHKRKMQHMYTSVWWFVSQVLCCTWYASTSLSSCDVNVLVFVIMSHRSLTHDLVRMSECGRACPEQRIFSCVRCGGASGAEPESVRACLRAPFLDPPQNVKNHIK